MLSLSSRVRVESQTRPGVVFIIRKRTEKRRVQLRLKMAAIQQRIDAALGEIQAIGNPPYAGVEADKLTDEQRAAQAQWLVEKGEAMDVAYDAFNTILHDEVHPAWVEWALEKIEGLTVDEQTITGANAAELIESDDPMWGELVSAVEQAAGLTKKQAANLELPTTSSAVVDGQTPDTTAPAANETSTI
jgi:hypothetical protein